MDTSLMPRGLRCRYFAIGAGLLMAAYVSPSQASQGDPDIGNTSAVPAMGPSLQILNEQLMEGMRFEEEARKIRFFQVIADNDKIAFSSMLEEGIDPNVTLPFPPPREFSKRFPDELVQYYVANEPGFTALMLATMLDHADFVRSLLNAGADPWKKTRRHKTFALWLAGKYGNIEIMRSLMKIAEGSEAMRQRITVDLTLQRATLWRDDQVVMEMPISSGRASHPTPKGRYLITNKYRTWKSTLYPAKMPYFLRLSCGDFGLHSGYLPGYPASHGCIRLPDAAARRLFAEAPVGTLVEIQ